MEIENGELGSALPVALVCDISVVYLGWPAW